MIMKLDAARTVSHQIV